MAGRGKFYSLDNVNVFLIRKAVRLDPKGLRRKENLWKCKAFRLKTKGFFA